MRGLINATVSDNAFSDGDLGGSRDSEVPADSQACGGAEREKLDKTDKIKRRTQQNKELMAMMIGEEWSSSCVLEEERTMTVLTCNCTKGVT